MYEKLPVVGVCISYMKLIKLGHHCDTKELLKSHNVILQ